MNEGNIIAAGISEIGAELISGQPFDSPFSDGDGNGFAPGYQIRTADEDVELLRRSQSLFEDDGADRREAVATASRIFDPNDDEDDALPLL